MTSGNEIFEDKVILCIDSTVYSKEAIIKCLYWYSDKFTIDISLGEKNQFQITLIPFDTVNKLSTESLNLIYKKLKKDLLDFQLRHIVIEETKNIRDLLVAKAFSSFDTEEKIP